MELQQKIEFVKNAFAAHPSLVHASNIIGKIEKETGCKRDAILSLASSYADYLQASLNLHGYTDETIRQRVASLNRYYTFYDHNEAYDYNSMFKSRGKLRPTILEEFVYFLFKDYLDELKTRYNDTLDTLRIGSVKAYTNLYFSPFDLRNFLTDPSVSINEKDQDFAIYRTVNFVVDEQERDKREYVARIPVFAVEAKTYLDKTMLDGVIATAEKLKTGNPYARFVVVAETYQVSANVDPSYSKIDQIYVLRKCRKLTDDAPMIQDDVVIRLFSEAKRHLESPWSDVKSKLQHSGIII